MWSYCADCERTCENMHIACPASSCKREGCVCPEGMVKSEEGKCVEKTECSCVYRGRSYEEGTISKRGCNKWYEDSMGVNYVMYNKHHKDSDRIETVLTVI